MAANTELQEMTAQYKEQKARASDLSRDLDLARREIKTWQDEAAQVPGLKERIGELEEELKAASQQNEALTKASQDAEVNTSRDQKRAEAFVQIRDALATK